MASDSTDARLLAGLVAAMLPYLWFVCLAAQLSATLQALGNFRLPALVATLLNLGWLAGAWWVAPHVAETAAGRAYALAGSIVVAGALQAAIQLAALGRLGLGGLRGIAWPRSDENSRLAWQRIVRPMGPIALALSVTQISTLVDSVAGLAAHSAGRRSGIHCLAAGRRWPIPCVPGPRRRFTMPKGFISCRSACWAWPPRR